MKRVSCQYWPWILISVSVAHAIKFDVHEQECWMHETESDKEVVQMFVEVGKDVSPGPSRHMGVDIVVSFLWDHQFFVVFKCSYLRHS